MPYADLIVLARQRLDGVQGIVGFGLGFVGKDSYGLHVIVSNKVAADRARDALKDVPHQISFTAPVSTLGPERR